MTRMTRAVVENAHLDPLDSASTSLSPVEKAIDDNAENMHRTVHGLAWTGTGRTEALGRADAERTQMRRVSDAASDLAKAFSHGKHTMAPMVDSLKTSAAHLTEADFNVAQDWTVTDGYQYGLAEATYADNPQKMRELHELQRKRAEEAKNATVRLQRLAHELEAADDDTAKAIRAAKHRLEAMAPASKAMSWKQAKLDVESLRDGHPTPEQLARLRAATHLSPQDMASLAAGKPTNISQGQFDYLQSMMRQLHGVSLQDMLDINKQAPGLLGDGFRLMSMPNLQTEGGSRGGMDELPIPIRTLLQQNPILVTTHVPNTLGAPIQAMTAIPRLGDFNALNTLLGEGNQNLRLGADVDRGLLKQASEISSVMGPRGSHDYYGTYDNRQDLGSIRQTVDAMLHNGGGDHQAVADFLTGDNMASTVTPGSHYHADSHLRGLLEQKWMPDELGAKSMMHWIGGAADDHGYESVLGGRSADALAKYMVAHHDELAYIGPKGGPYSSLGILNPELTQEISRSLSPYFPNFAGYPSDLLLNHTAGPLADTDDFGKLIGLLGTDKKAGDIAILSATSWENYAAHEYGEDPMNVGLGTSASHLHQSVAAGIGDAQKILQSNQEWTSEVEYDDKQKKAANILGFLQGLNIPGLSDAATMAGPEIADQYAGQKPGDPSLSHSWQGQIEGYNKTYDGMTGGVARQYQIASGYLEDHPEIIDRHWKADDGSDINFFQKDKNGHVEFNPAAIRKNSIDFERFLKEKGVPLSDYLQSYDARTAGTTIDNETRQLPSVATKPPG